jgi:predicted transport protein
MEKGLIEKTGKNLKHWITVVKKTGLKKHTEILNYLKSNHALTHGFANFVSLKARASDAGSFNEKDLIENQYLGKDNLVSIYNVLDKVISSLGDDITITPKKDSISYIRKRQFALIKPATKTRIDLGLKIKDKPTEGKLENSGPFGTMRTHRVKLQSEKDITLDVINWIKEAYKKSI